MVLNSDQKIAVLGSTGSVGRQTLDVAAARNVRVVTLAAHNDVTKMEEQARRFHPLRCVMSDEKAAKELALRLADTDIKVNGGKEALAEAAQDPDADMIFNSVGGAAGLPVTLAAVRAGKTLALANKESIVLAGELVMREAEKNHVLLLPVDSEHCAIHQCLRAGEKKEVSRLILTASGGPFRGRSRDSMKNVTPAEALGHPTWSMGKRITVDSATMLNKGFEVIEAVHLFGIPEEKVDVLVHPQSIIHSMVEYADNSVIAQMSIPDMRLCCQYAMTYPERVTGIVKKLDLSQILGGLTFEKPNERDFPMLTLARKALKEGGILPAALNASDEVAVKAFLDGKLAFTDIHKVCEKTVSEMPHLVSPDPETILASCEDATRRAEETAAYLAKHPFAFD